MFDKYLIDHANKTRNDGMMHFSSGLQNARHAVLGYVHGYPEVKRHWGEVAQLITGTAIHEYMHDMFTEESKNRTLFYSPEIPIEPVDINGVLWTGTADAVIIDDTGQKWLIDYKTTSSNTFEYLDGKPKTDHIIQVSAYYHFMREHNLDDAKCAIMYIPTSPTYSRKWAEPTLMEFEPVGKEHIIDIMKYVTKGIYTYQDSGFRPAIPDGEWGWKFDKRAKKWKLSHKPHWSTRFCPWEHDLNDPCTCSTETIKDGGTWCPETNEYNLTAMGENCVEFVTKPWELDNSEKV